MTDDEIDENEKMLMQAFAFQDDDLKQDYVAFALGSYKEGIEIASKEKVIEALQTVIDPEIDINIYDLGLVYDIRIDEKANVEIDMTVTSPMCPVAGALPKWAADAVCLVEGTNEIFVKIVWEPMWKPEMMSEDAKMMMGIF